MREGKMGLEMGFLITKAAEAGSLVSAELSLGR